MKGFNSAFDRLTKKYEQFKLDASENKRQQDYHYYTYEENSTHIDNDSRWEHEKQIQDSKVWAGKKDLDVQVETTEDGNYIIRMNEHVYICVGEKKELKRRLETLIEKHMMMSDLSGDNNEDKE